MNRLITYNRATGRYDVVVDGRPLGSARSYLEAEALIACARAADDRDDADEPAR